MKVQIGEREIHIRFATGGRVTTCVVAEDEHMLKVLDTGVTMRRVKELDNPNRAREISLSRAIKELPRPQRFLVWEKYIKVYKPKALKSFYRDAEISKNRLNARRHPPRPSMDEPSATGLPRFTSSGLGEA